MDKKRYLIVEELWHNYTLIDYLRAREYYFSMSGSNITAPDPAVPRPPGKESKETSYVHYRVQMTKEDITALLIAVPYISVSEEDLEVDGK